MSVLKKYKDKTLKDLFNESILDLRTTFPNKLKNLIVLASEEEIFIAPEILDSLDKEFLDGIRKNIIRSMKENNTGGMAVNIKEKDLLSDFLKTNNKEINFIPIIFMNEINIDNNLQANEENSLEVIHDIWNFDHEIGHIILKNGCTFENQKNLNISEKYGEHIAECTADTFAALRCIQRLGYDEGKKIINKKDQAYRCKILEGEPTYYHYNAIYPKIIERLKEKDITILSLQETAELAEEISNRFYEEEHTLKKIKSIFENKFSYEECYIDKLLKEVIKHKKNPSLFKSLKFLLDTDLVQETLNYIERLPQKEFNKLDPSIINTPRTKKLIREANKALKYVDHKKKQHRPTQQIKKALP